MLLRKQVKHQKERDKILTLSEKQILDLILHCFSHKRFFNRYYLVTKSIRWLSSSFSFNNIFNTYVFFFQSSIYSIYLSYCLHTAFSWSSNLFNILNFIYWVELIVSIPFFFEGGRGSRSNKNNNKGSSVQGPGTTHRKHRKPRTTAGCVPLSTAPGATPCVTVSH